MKKKQSILALALQDMMKKSGRSHKAVAEVLGVSDETISRYVHDKALPRPGHIEGILNIVCRSDGTESAVKNFYWMTELPAKQVTPFHRKVGRDINSYLTKYRIAEIQKRVLTKTCTKKLRRNEELCRKLAEFVRTTF